MTISYFAKEYFLCFHLWTWNIFPAIAWPMNIDKSLTLSGNSYWIMNTKDSIQIFIRRGFKQNEAFLNIYHQAENPINWKSIAANGRLWWGTLKMQHRVEQLVLFCKAQFIGNTYNYLYLVIIKLTQVWIHRNMTFFADWKRHTLTRFGQLNLHRHLLFFWILTLQKF